MQNTLKFRPNNLISFDFKIAFRASESINLFAMRSVILSHNGYFTGRTGRVPTSAVPSTRIFFPQKPITLNFTRFESVRIGVCSKCCNRFAENFFLRSQLLHQVFGVINFVSQLLVLIHCHRCLDHPVRDFPKKHTNRNHPDSYRRPFCEAEPMLDFLNIHLATTPIF